MVLHKDPFRAFQEELAGLDRDIASRKAAKAAPQDRLSLAKAEFEQLRERYKLSVADVITFFPEEEGVAYLQELIAANEAKPKRRRKAGSTEAE